MPVSASRSAASTASAEHAADRTKVEAMENGRSELRVRTRAGEWIRIHSAHTPDAEARGMVDRALQGRGVPPVVAVIGVGLGFVVDELFRRAPTVRILALEVLPELVPHWQRRVDLSARLSSGQLLIAVDPAFDLPAAPWPGTAFAADPLVIFHPALAHHWPDAAQRAQRALAQFMFERRANEEARQRLAPLYHGQTLENLPALLKATDVSALDGIATGEPLILCGAGPSLDRLLPELKAERERAWFVALDTAVRPLMAAGIVPDLVVSIDPTTLNGRHLLDLPLRQRPWLVAETSLDPRAIAAFSGRLFACRINRADPWPWLETLEIAPTRLKAWGSVLTSACDLVTRMQPSSVAFAAIDLAYTNGQTYCRGTAFEQDWEEQRIQEGLASIEAVWDARLRGQTLEEPDINGQPTRTSGHLVAFRNWVRNLVAETPACRFVNVTEAGILHGTGIQQTTLRRWLQERQPLGRVPEQAVRAVVAGTWRNRAPAVAEAVASAISTDGEPWTAWNERVPGLDRGKLARVLEHGRRRACAAREGTGMSAAAQTDWVDVPFDASHYDALEPMQWRVQDHANNTYAYRVDGKSLYLSFKINRSSVLGPPARELYLRLPANHVAARGTANAVWIGSRAIKEMGYATVHPGQDRLVIHRANEEPFPNDDGYFFLFGQLVLEVQ